MKATALLVIAACVAALAGCSPDEASEKTPKEISFKSCAEVREAGRAPLRKGDIGYSKNLDRDGDGVACDE